MAPKRGEVAGRLRQARGEAGLSQERVAEWLGVRRPAIAEIESGKRAVKSTELVRLADLYGKSLRWLAQGTESAEERLTAVLFRTGAQEDGLLRMEVAKLARRCRLLVEIESALGLRRHHRLQHYVDEDAVHDYSLAMEHGREVAYLERTRLGIGPAAPIRDVWGVVEDAGLHVFPLHLGRDRDLDGVFARTSEDHVCVGVNVDKWVFRQVFTAAHEYGHALMDRDMVGEGCVTDRAWKRQGVDLYANRELRANQFAAVFLVPREALVRYLSAREKLTRERGGERARALTIFDIVRAQDHFGVSSDMLLWRLRNESMIDAAERNKLRNALNTIGVTALAQRLGYAWRDRAQPFERVQEIALKAYAKGIISLGVLADVFDMSKEQIHEFVTSLGIVQEFTEDDLLLGAIG